MQNKPLLLFFPFHTAGCRGPQGYHPYALSLYYVPPSVVVYQISSLLHKMASNHHLSTAEKAMQGRIQNPETYLLWLFATTLPIEFIVSCVKNQGRTFIHCKNRKYFMRKLKLPALLPAFVCQQIQIHQFLTHWSREKKKWKV